ncbi:glutamate ABC transporter substrate-binding protein [Bifidobacterium aquikefiricola]|uniref:Glutamate ABC transporter substrate-binding protein n=1 Tax=Bifidobacterium aquikefiricola TaxID=3059038 RepID=A0AB39U4J5_9BIFI
MKRVMRKILAAAVSIAALGSLAACGSSSSNTSSGPQLKIGIKFDQPGLGFKQGSTYSGFDVDVAKYVAKKLGYSENQIVWKEAPSKQRETLIQNGDVDMVVATYSISDDRKKVVDFAGPYFVAGQDLLIRANDTSITGPKSLNGKKLCSVTGSTSAQTIQSHFADKVQLMEQTGYAECVTALISGTVDAVTTDDIILAGLAAAKGDGQLKVVGKPFTQERYGIGVKKGDTELVKKINAALKDMISDGSWKKYIDSATKGTGYTPNSEFNPPTVFDAKSSTTDF